MIPFPLTLPEEFKDIYTILDALAHRLRKDDIDALALRLKKLKSEALKRSLDWRASGSHYAQNCIICKGTGQAHFCTDPFCHPESELSKEDCLHFTPHELEIYVAIHRDYVEIIREMHSLVSTGVPIKDLIDLNDRDKKAHPPN